MPPTPSTRCQCIRLTGWFARAGEIGLRQVQTGEIRPVKVLGVLAMIDDDETDWKVRACVEIKQYVVCTR